MNAFHAYDIRGIYNKDFTKEDVYKIGFFLPRVLKARKILVGRDVRVSSPEIYEYLTKGLVDSGTLVYNIGLSTTPMTYFATAKFNFKGSVQITASHNPKEYNGLKISGEDAIPIGYDTGLAELEKLVENEELEAYFDDGGIIDFDVKEDYLTFLKGYCVRATDLNIGIDCSNGMAALLIKDIFGDKPKYIFDELDGTFPNHEANPLVPENIVDIQRLVNENNLDVGIIFDGDADRVMFIDDKGKFVSPDLIIALLGHFFLEERKKKGIVLQDIRTSKAVGEYISEKFDSQVEIWRVGRAYAARKLREIEGLFGGELAGHYYFKDFYYSDSGLLAAIIVVRILTDLKEKGISMSQAISEIIKYENSGEINFKLNKKSEAINAVVGHFLENEEPEKILDFDGYRLEYEDWWFNIRPSNTEPYLRLIVEAKNQELLHEKVAEIKKIIEYFD